MFLKHQISVRVISEGSCDTEDWSNDAGILTRINYFLKYIKIEMLFCIVILFPNITVFTVFFNQINAAFVSI